MLHSLTSRLVSAFSGASALIPSSVTPSQLPTLSRVSDVRGLSALTPSSVIPHELKSRQVSAVSGANALTPPVVTPHMLKESVERETSWPSALIPLSAKLRKHHKVKSSRAVSCPSSALTPSSVTPQ
mmetsp:Transcript_9927/g.17032  ORF Transcript_9927/g.17032 Transcript_9927/m.17032 type:complete len:127 (-) Transcript_9927:23-403(-)